MWINSNDIGGNSDIFSFDYWREQSFPMEHATISGSVSPPDGNCNYGSGHIIEVVHGMDGKQNESCSTPYALVSPSEKLGRIAISQNLSCGMLYRSHLDSYRHITCMCCYNLLAVESLKSCVNNMRHRTLSAV
jgi:hypothetical protein